MVSRSVDINDMKPPDTGTNPLLQNAAVIDCAQEFDCRSLFGFWINGGAAADLPGRMFFCGGLQLLTLHSIGLRTDTHRKEHVGIGHWSKSRAWSNYLKPR